jgi:hypothetical protein
MYERRCACSEMKKTHLGSDAVVGTFQLAVLVIAKVLDAYYNRILEMRGKVTEFLADALRPCLHVKFITVCGGGRGG